jgi:hypothetical protein
VEAAAAVAVQAQQGWQAQQRVLAPAVQEQLAMECCVLQAAAVLLLLSCECVVLFLLLLLHLVLAVMLRKVVLWQQLPWQAAQLHSAA